MYLNSSRFLTPHAADLTSLGGVLFRQARLRPEQMAFAMLNDQLEIGQSLTFSETANNASVLAAALLKIARPGDRVLLAYHNGLDAVQAFWGCIVAGLIPVPAPAPDSGHSRVALSRLKGMVSDAGIRLALTSEDAFTNVDPDDDSLHWCTIDKLLAEADYDGVELPALNHQSDSLAYLQYTSGSMAAPRGVEITHAAALAQCQALQHTVAVDSESDRSLVWLPWFHDYGLIHALIQPVYTGCTSFLMATLSYLRRPLRWLEAVDKHNITATGAPNFAYEACVQALGRTSNWPVRLESLRLMSCGAEPLRKSTLDSFCKAFAPHGLSPQVLAPSYGLAEAVLVVSMAHNGYKSLCLQKQELEHHRVVLASDQKSSARNESATTSDTTEIVSCGELLMGFSICVVDPATCKPVNDDQIGEIWISGPSIGRGYWNNREASQAAFNAGLADEPETNWLRTGDLGFVDQGELYITGRSKDMLVVRGRNIYPQDLEQIAEQAHPAVRSSGVIAVGVVPEKGPETVVLLAECRGRPDPVKAGEIQEAIRNDVATSHEIEVLEVALVRSGSLPRTSSGKPQRSRARQMYLQGDLDGSRLQIEQPRSMSTTDADAALKSVLGVWLEVLQLDDLQPDTDFFDAGGDSLLATQIISRINATFQVELTVESLFEAPNPLAFTEILRATEKAPATPELPALTGNRTGPLPLSFAQERMWFMHCLAPESTAYNIPLALRMKGKLDKNALRVALQHVIARHEILRTRFELADAGASAWLEETDVTVPIEEVDCFAADQSDGRSLEATLQKLTNQPFDLSHLPLMRVSLVQVAENEAILLWVMHHIISDQWSCAVLGRELAASYAAAVTGKSPQLPELELQYADFAAWQRQWFTGARREQQLAYWQQQLAGLEPLQLNEDFPRARQPDYRGSQVRRELDAEKLAALNKLGAEHGASLSMVLIAVLKVLLLRHTGVSDIALGVPVANRNHLSNEKLLGTFVNTLVLRTNVSGNPDFIEVLRRVREVSLQAYTHQDMPFELLVRELSLPHDTSRSPLFDVIFNMINTPARGIEFPGLSWSRLDFDRGAAQFDLAVNVDAMYHPGIVFEYANALFTRETIERLADHYLRILDAILDESATRVMDIVLLTEPDRARLQQWGQGTRTSDNRLLSVNEQVARHAEQTPEAPAVICGNRLRSYAQLNSAANQLAMEIRSRGLGRGKKIALCLPRSEHLPEVLLAMLRSGAAYVPLDPSHPRERLLYQVQDAGIDLLIATEQTARILDWPPEGTLLLERDAAAIARHSGEPLPPDELCDARPEDPVYIIYTSGSTGRPKGVSVPHRAMTNFLNSMRAVPGMTRDDSLLAVTTLGFDIAVLELYLPLLIGARVVVVEDAAANDGHALAQMLVDHDVTIMQATPSRWRMLLDTGWTGKPDLKALVGGEPLAPDLAARLIDGCGELWNMYGPTETTVWSSCRRVDSTAIEPVSLGQPIAETTLQVLEENGHLCAPGVPGELCIGGKGLALGYHGQPVLTAAQFVTAEKYSAFPESIIYRTGDSARWRHDGRLEHLGRMDSQLKLRGYRIEPGEIESHLQRHDGVARAVVVIHEEDAARPQLVAYVVVDEAISGATDEDLRARLRQWVPEYMVPQQIVRLDRIPTLPNGKLDRRSLPAPPASAPISGERTLPQSDSEEQLLTIWQAVLGRHDFGVHDNFFDVGGHSMLAVNLVKRIGEEMQVDCPLSLLFQYPTVFGMDSVLNSNSDMSSDPVAVQLLAAGTDRPMFFLSGTHLYRELATGLPPGSRVYGLLSAAEAGLLRQGRKLPDVIELARSYVTTIRRLQPHGPYRVAGFSIGGVIAFEAACQLRDAGEQVELVALVDCGAPGFGWQHIERWLKKRLLLIRRYGLGYLSRIAKASWALRSGASTEDGNAAQTPMYAEYARVIRRYQAGQWEAPLTFVQAAGDPIREPGYGWKLHAPDLAVELVPGEHMDMLKEPAVSQIAQRLTLDLRNLSAKTP
ncbi:MAG: amino acid adenylation domain-containing protein [Pseudomonadales bacterium]